MGIDKRSRQRNFLSQMVMRSGRLSRKGIANKRQRLVLLLQGGHRVSQKVAHIVISSSQKVLKEEWDYWTRS
jgi:hypothetical protein